jgi:redox-sensing transcriptional repressor
MMKRIPDVVVRRMPLYLRAVEDFARRGHEVVSSQELGDWTGLTPAQVRKDFTFFGEFGKQGIGYNVKFLRQQLREILRISENVHVGLVGFGNLGRALAHYLIDSHVTDNPEFGSPDKLRVTAAFDVDESIVGTDYRGMPIFHVDRLSEIVHEHGIKIIVIAVPARHAQAVATKCAEAGVKAILNFAPVTLNVPDEVKVHHTDLTLELQSLAFYTA